MPTMIPISFDGSGPDGANVKELGDHHGAGGEDHAAGVCQAADHRLARVVGAVPVLFPVLTQSGDAHH
jgi:hypothetical protein